MGDRHDRQPMAMIERIRRRVRFSLWQETDSWRHVATHSTELIPPALGADWTEDSGDGK